MHEGGNPSILQSASLLETIGAPLLLRDVFLLLLTAEEQMVEVHDIH